MAPVEPASGPDAEVVFQPGGDAARYAGGQLVGQGGMGQVRVAYDRVLRRDVALKELHPNRVGDEGAKWRMAREAWITAWLDHPAIVAVHDAGHLEDGRPYYTMRLIRGRTLASALREPGARQGLIRHLQLVCDALASAHAAGIVHRDLKPTNILIGGHGETQVIDWGLATPTAEAVARWPELARLADPNSGSFLGTPEYASPEQARGEAPDLRDDVFSLGVILRELVDTPSENPELWAIVQRATAPTRAERYPDAAALSAELLRWFEGRRVEAYAYTPTELLLRLVRAWRVPLAVGAASLLALALAVGVGWIRTQHQRNRAIAAEHQQEQARRAAEAALSDSLVQQAIAATAEDARPRAEKLAMAAIRARDSAAARGIVAAFAFAPRPRRVSSLTLPGISACGWSALSADALLCGRDEETLLAAGDVRRTLPAANAGRLRGGEIWLVGQDLALTRASRDGLSVEASPAILSPWMPLAGFRVPVYAGQRWMPPRTKAPCDRGILIVEPSPDERRLITLCGDGQVLLGTPERPAQRSRITSILNDAEAVSAAWTPDGRAVAIGTLRGELHMLDGATGEPLGAVRTSLGTINALAISQSGLVAVSGNMGGVGLWDWQNARWLGEIPAQRPRSCAFDGEELLVFDGALTRWSLPGSARPYRHEVPAGLSDLALSPDGRRLALAGGDGRLTVIDVQSGRRIQDIRLGDRVAKSVAYAPDGQQIAVSLMSRPSLIRVAPDGRTLADERALSQRRLAWLADGALLGIDIYKGVNRFLESGIQRLEQAMGRVFMDLEQDGAAAIALEIDGGIWEFGASEGRLLREEPGAVVVARRGGVLAWATESALHLPAHPPIEVPGAGFRDLSVSPAGRYAAAGGLDGHLRVWEVESGALVLDGVGHAERIAAVEFSPDGRFVATASWDHTARIWDLSVLDTPAEALTRAVHEAWGDR